MMPRETSLPFEEPRVVVVHESPLVPETVQPMTLITFQKTPAVSFFFTSVGLTFHVMIFGCGGGLHPPFVQPH